MKRHTTSIQRILRASVSLLVGACFAASTLAQPARLAHLASFPTQPGGGEIQAFDPATKTLIGTMTGGVEFYNLSDPSAPKLAGTLNLSAVFPGDTLASISSVAVDAAGRGFGVALAIPSNNGMTRGKIVFFSLTTRTILRTLDAGFHPDMATFTPNGDYALVANEGEPQYAGDTEDGNVVVDAEGSVSVIDLTAVTGLSGIVGLTQNNVLEASFAPFNGKRAELQAKGVRLFPAYNTPTTAPTVAQDLEPEYIAVSADGLTATVTLQEANAIAVIEICTAKVLDIHPLGVKDHSKGLPVVSNYPFPALPVLGSTAATDPMGVKASVTPQNILLGGFSGLWFEGVAANGNWKFVTVPDRGPNGKPTNVDGDPAKERPFALPGFQARMVAFELNPDTGAITIGDTTLLTRDSGATPITGLPNSPAADEEPVDLFGNALPYDPYGADIESVTKAPDGTWWMVDECRPAIYQFNANGVLIHRYVPKGAAAADGQAAGTYGEETLPEVYGKRRSNRGFEAGAFDTDSGLFYAFIQTPLQNPNRAASDSSAVIRMLGIDPATGAPVSEFVYLLEKPSHRSSNVDKIGDAVYAGNGRFLVIERDSATDSTGKKFIFEIDIKGASNLQKPNCPQFLPGKALEQHSVDELAAIGLRAVYKQKVCNLPSIGYLAGDKAEGLALLPNGSLAVLNDNDFGLDDQPIAADGTIVLAAQPAVPTLGVISFNRSNGLDPSNRDNATAIVNAPVLGQFMPDTIASYSANGRDYYVTANEGDARDFFERRVKDLTLDPTEFPNAAELQADGALGRLKSSIIDGDIDGDGDKDRIVAYGGRSFSIWDEFGNLVFDSGDQIAARTLLLDAALFNAGDSRSDDKGAEPEGVATGVIDGRAYAFIGLERTGGVMMFDVTNPNETFFVDYLSTLTSHGNERPEGLKFIGAADSPNGKPLLVVGYEVSNTIGIFDLSAPTDVEVTANILADTTWTSDKTYFLNGPIYVMPGATLTIEPGTVIKGRSDADPVKAAVLFVTRGAKIMALGTAGKPIIFTSEDDDVNDPTDLGPSDRGLWGGLVLMGNAQLNSAKDTAGNAATPIYEVFEGLPDITRMDAGGNPVNVHRFGGADDSDNSGVLRYVSVRHGGVTLESDSEINGITMGAIGKGTTIEFCEVFANDDDGFEWFGGCVNTKYLISAFNADDSFDVDQGYRGNNQFWFAIQDPAARDSAGEHDGSLSPHPGRTPETQWTVFNATYIGGGGVDAGVNRAFLLSDDGSPKYYNSVFTEFNTGIEIAGDNVDRLNSAEVDFRYNIWGNIGIDGGTKDTIAELDGGNAAVLFNESIRHNEVADPMLRGIGWATGRFALDPRPAAGSPAWKSGRPTPKNGFFSEVDYKGAFGARNWAAGWTALSSGGLLNTANPGVDSAPVPAAPTIVQVTANVTVDAAWTAGNEYVLNGPIYVMPGATLTIEPGTVIRGKFDAAPVNAAVLFITRGAKIMAEGTEDDPIIFTSDDDDLSDPTDLLPSDRGLWGGLVLMGNAKMNSAKDTAGNAASPIYEVFEGLPDITRMDAGGNPVNVHRFGGNDDNDNSGILRYVSVRHGGVTLESDSEINGITMGAVGKGTTIEYCEVFANDDDGFEWFGGCVNTKYLVSAFNSDDSFDTDQGYRGNNQFWFVIQDPTNRDSAGEHDGSLSPHPGRTPETLWTVFNATYIGGGGVDAGVNRGFLLSDDGGPKYYNSVFTEFNTGIKIADDNADRLTSGDVDFRDNIWGNIGLDGGSKDTTAELDGGNAAILFSDGTRNNQVADPLLTGLSWENDGGLDPRPQASSPAWVGSATGTGFRPTPENGFFSQVTYKGAFGTRNWAAKWTALAQNSILTNEGAAQEDAELLTSVEVTDNILADTTWTSDMVYYLNGPIYVMPGATLTIEAGTVVKGRFNAAPVNAAVLFVTRGAKIMAEGTMEKPIIFTSEDDNLLDPNDLTPADRGLWGGIVLMGNAQLNSAKDTAGNAATPIYEVFEGLPDITQIDAGGNPVNVHRFGGNDDSDNSGVLRFVSVRHGGVTLESDSEINGITMGAIGKGTTIEFCEVFANDDDGFEWFGGCVNTKYLISAFNADDSFDVDQGYRGNNQFWFAIQDPTNRDSAGEHDGSLSPHPGRTPETLWTVFNATYIGGGGVDAGVNRAFLLSDDGGPKYYNSVFTEFNTGIEIANDNLDRLNSADVDFRYNLWGNIGLDGGTKDTLAELDDGNAAILFTDSTRHNQVADPMLSGVSWTSDGGLDPRPAAGSPALWPGRPTPKNGFFSEVSFKGAFGEENWAAKWSAIANVNILTPAGAGVPNPVVPALPTWIQVTADITADATWTADNEYVLNGPIYVMPGATLTIEPGTVIRGKFDAAPVNAAVLFVTRGAKIMAEGTADRPIIFTSEDDDVSDPTDLLSSDRGLWGGLVLMGNAKMNSAKDTAGNAASPIYEVFEGLPDITRMDAGENPFNVHRFGGNDDNDNSGVLRYVSVRHGGVTLESDSEINGITMGAVGKGTTIEYCEVYANDDDGFEWFGGCVNTKYLVSAFNSDDSFDVDQGYRGHNQFWFVIQDPTNRDSAGEHDGSLSPHPGRTPETQWTVFNATYVGGGGVDAGVNRGFLLSDDGAPKYYNSVFTEFNKGVEIAGDNVDRLTSGDVDFRNNIWGNIGLDGGSKDTIAELDGGNAGVLFTDGARNNQVADPMLTSLSWDTDSGLDPRPQASSPAWASSPSATAFSSVPENGFYSVVDYKGAFGEQNWAAKWTALAQSSILTHDGAGFKSGQLVALDNSVVVTGTITTDAAWTADKTYILSGPVYVMPGATLTIEPGTVIKGRVDAAPVNAAVLFITRGATLIADGTAERPIIFTSEDDDVNDPTDLGPSDRGLWGGLVLMGNARLNSAKDTAGNAASPIYEVFEGLPDITRMDAGGNPVNVHRFGGNDDSDNSGVLRFVSVRHGGVTLESDSEINGITMGAVGKGTTIEFCEVFANDDDGFEWFGGCVNTKYLISAFNADDSFDVDQGYRGNNQFWFVIQDPNARDSAGEHDGSLSPHPGRMPETQWTVFNATYIGGGGEDAGVNRAFLLSDDGSPKYFNSVFTEFNTGIEIAGDNVARLTSGEVDFRYNIWGNIGIDGGSKDTLTELNGGNAAVLFTDATRHNRIADPMLRGVSWTGDKGLDPRPAAGSPAWNPGRSVPANGFFCDVDYKGAFGQVNWAAGWSAISVAGILTEKGAGVPAIDPIPAPGIVMKSGELTTDETWTANNVYMLQGPVYVMPGQTLTIEPGTVIKGVFDAAPVNAAVLFITRGAKIMAMGTADKPIIFTSEDDDVSDPTDLLPSDRGLWGGIVLMGNARLNSAKDTAGNAATPIYEVFEGLPDVTRMDAGGNPVNVHRFGGNDDNDNSGVLRYVSVRHGGVTLESDSEINGITMGAIGKGTIIEFCEVFANDDDGFEWFGGCVNTRYLVAAFNADDSFDVDQGYRGENQFWFVIQDPTNRDSAGEHDGSLSPHPGRTPETQWTVHNATYIGGGGVDAGVNRGFLMSDDGAPKYYNSVFTEFNTGIEIAGDNVDRLTSGELDFRNNIWFNIGLDGGSKDTLTELDGGHAAILFTDSARMNDVIDPQLRGVSWTGDFGLDPRIQPGSPAMMNVRQVPAGGFIKQVTYKGAFGAVNWAAKWTALAQTDIMSREGQGQPVDVVVGAPVVANGVVSMVFATGAGLHYQIQASEDLTNWVNVGASFPGTGGMLQFTEGVDPNVAGTFYRILEVPAP